MLTIMHEIVYDSVGNTPRCVVVMQQMGNATLGSISWAYRGRRKTFSPDKYLFVGHDSIPKLPQTIGLPGNDQHILVEVRDVSSFGILDAVFEEALGARHDYSLGR